MLGQRVLCVILVFCMFYDIACAVVLSKHHDRPDLATLCLGVAVFCGWVAWYTWPSTVRRE
jgi:hypothetical protein